MFKKILHSLFLLLLFIPGISSANQQDTLEPVTLQLKWLHHFQFAGYYAALEQGFYAEEGLDVNIKELRSDRDIVSDVVHGETHYAVGDSGILNSYANGAPIKALAAIFQHNGLVFISKQTSGIVSPYEMAGKRIMFDAHGTDSAPLKATLNEARLSSDDYISVARDFNLHAFLNNDVDVMSAYITVQPFELQQQGIAINIINPQNYGFDFYGDLLYTSQAEIDNHPDRVARFRRASLKGWRYALDHSEEIIQLIKDRYNSSLSLEALRYEAKQTRKLIRPEIVALGSMQASRLRRLADIYAKMDLVAPLSDEKLENFTFNNASTLLFSEKEQAWLDAHPIIRLGIDRDFAPYEWIDSSGQYIGLAADYMRLLEARLGVRFEIVDDKPWHEIQAMAKRGELDLLSCLNSSPERAQFLHFTPPYVNNLIVIINANRNGYVGTLENLAGKTVAIERDYYTHEYIANNHPDINLLLVDSTFEALNKVNIGEADAYVGDAAYADYAIKQSDLLNLQFAGQTNQTSSYRIGVHKSKPELHAIINRALNSITPEERTVIEDTWLGLNVMTGIPVSTLIKISIAIALLFLLFSHWIYRLRQTTHALQQSQTKLQSIIDASPIPHALNDNQRNITYLNQAFIDTFGYTLEDIPTLDSWLPKAYPDSNYRTWVSNTWYQRFNLSQKNHQKFEPIELEIQCKMVIFVASWLVKRPLPNQVITPTL